MSDFSTAGVTLALALLSLSVYVYVDKWVRMQCDAVVAGTVRGVAVSPAYRRSIVFVRWFLVGGAQTLWQGAVSIAWWVFARNVGVEEVRLFAYMVSFMFLGTAVTWLVYMPIWYSHLSAVLRQAEAD